MGIVAPNEGVIMAVALIKPKIAPAATGWTRPNASFTVRETDSGTDSDPDPIPVVGS